MYSHVFISRLKTGIFPYGFYKYVFEMSRLFIADQDQDFLGQVSSYMMLSGFSVTQFQDLTSVREALKSCIPDMLILSRGFSDGDALMFLKQLRNRNMVPVIIIGSQDSESDRILAFELGCDDYVTKPLSFKELSLRISAHLRRTEGSRMYDGFSTWVLGNETLSLDFSGHRMFLGSRQIELTGAEWRVMKLLCENCTSVLSRAQIIDECFDYSSESYDRIVDTHIKNIRAKLGATGTGWIETVRGYGYRFMGVRKVRS